MAWKRSRVRISPGPPNVSKTYPHPELPALRPTEVRNCATCGSCRVASAASCSATGAMTSTIRNRRPGSARLRWDISLNATASSRGGTRAPGEVGLHPDGRQRPAAVGFRRPASSEAGGSGRGLRFARSRSALFPARQYRVAGGGRHVEHRSVEDRRPQHDQDDRGIPEDSTQPTGRTDAPDSRAPRQRGSEADSGGAVIRIPTSPQTRYVGLIHGADAFLFPALWICPATRSHGARGTTQLPPGTNSRNCF